eukprot:7579661-Karenia_brevis.AAC.1
MSSSRDSTTRSYFKLVLIIGPACIVHQQDYLLGTDMPVCTRTRSSPDGNGFTPHGTSKVLGPSAGGSIKIHLASPRKCPPGR